ncbi:MAG TPA: sugar phosphate isomerase/epimerase family protein [Terriglobia bacterium]|nr:sugar phosphate isomerase/epimerase family protein [Terriglobia bacterium]
MDTHRLTRRRFMAATGAGIAGLTPQSLAAETLPDGAESSPAPSRKFYTVLSLGRLGLHGTFEQSVALATKYGFEGVDPDAGLFARLSEDELEKLLDDLKAKNIKLGAAGLPLDFRQNESVFNDGLAKLPDVAKALQRAGVRRVSTWVLPCSNDLTYLQNFRQHATRLRACASILHDHGQQLGLEYCGPRTFWRSQRHSFIHTLSEMKELQVAIGMDNLGVQLDSFHWFNAEETPEDIGTLRSRDIATVDLNDAPRVPLDDQHDGSRELPGATGVIPVAGFLGALLRIGYDGPIQAEPFNKALAALPGDEACLRTASAIKKAFAAAGTA